MGNEVISHSVPAQSAAKRIATRFHAGRRRWRSLMAARFSSVSEALHPSASGEDSSSGWASIQGPSYRIGPCDRQHSEHSGRFESLRGFQAPAGQGGTIATERSATISLTTNYLLFPNNDS